MSYPTTHVTIAVDLGDSGRSWGGALTDSVSSHDAVVIINQCTGLQQYTGRAFLDQLPPLGW